MKEIWKPINGYEDRYMISNRGRIKTIGRFITYRKGTSAVFVEERILKQSINPHGYCHVRLNDGKDYSIHRLVAIHFCENPNNEKVVDHIDGNKRNNFYKNLEWVSMAVNNQRAYDKGLKRRIHAGQFIDGVNRRK